MKSLIKVVNPDAANKLVALGFSYIEEQINNQKIYAFAENDEIKAILNSKFSVSDFFVDNKIRF